MDNPNSGGCSIALVFLLGLLASALLLFAVVPGGTDMSDSAPAPDIIVITNEAIQDSHIDLTATPDIIVVTATSE